MRLGFIVGGLEAGKDGVGDYTSALLAECIALGHEVTVVALNDFYIREALAKDVCVDGGSYKAIRLPSNSCWKKRCERTLEHCRSFEPDWLSLQFVPYAFHPKGINLWLGERLAPVFALGKCHIMFHELWIGESTDYSLKDRAVGLLQKRGVIRLLRKLAPALVHTSNPVYGELLKRNNQPSLELPLPGSIPLVQTDSNRLRIRAVSKEQSEMESFGRLVVVAGIFGTIHPQWSPEGWLEILCTYLLEQRKRLLILQIGHTPNAGRMIWKLMQKEFSDRCDFKELGSLSSEQVSTAFSGLDFGIATSPWALIGKSSSTAAMIDHGIPVVVPLENWRLRKGKTPEPARHPLLFRFDEFLALVRSGKLARSAACSRRSAVAQQMIGQMCENNRASERMSWPVVGSRF